MKIKKFKKPIRTEILWNGIRDSSMSILGETEKAYFFTVSTLVRQGTSRFSKLEYFDKWIPKSVWDNESNFETYLLGGDTGLEVTSFMPPYFLNKYSGR